MNYAYGHCVQLTVTCNYKYYVNGLPPHIVLECQRSRELLETGEIAWQAGQRLSLAFGPSLNSARLNIPERIARIETDLRRSLAIASPQIYAGERSARWALSILWELQSSRGRDA